MYTTMSVVLQSMMYTWLDNSVQQPKQASYSAILRPERVTGCIQHHGTGGLKYLDEHASPDGDVINCWTRPNTSRHVQSWLLYRKGQSLRNTARPNLPLWTPPWTGTVENSKPCTGQSGLMASNGMYFTRSREGLGDNRVREPVCVTWRLSREYHVW